jgi:transitional endoplasmic reticulum ATPase
MIADVKNEFHIKIDHKIPKHNKIFKISQADSQNLGISTGDWVLLKNNKKKTVAAAIVSKMSNSSFIEVNKIVSKILDLNNSSKVCVERITENKMYLKKIMLKTEIDVTELNSDQIEQLENNVKERCLDKLYMVNDLISLKVNNKITYFTIINIKPDLIGQIDEDTKILFDYEPISTRVFSDITQIGGMKYVIQKVRELVILPLKHPELYEPFNETIKPLNGLILVGPTGTGKTMLMKTLAKSSNINYQTITSVNIFGNTYGESEKNIKEIFKTAKEKSPTIIFFDEFDAIAPKRMTHMGEMEKRVVSQILIEMDNIADHNDVMIVAATNKINNIDPSFRVSGRLDYEIRINPPNEIDRLEILKIYTKPLPKYKNLNLKKIAKLTNGYVGADLVGIIREAIHSAIRREFPNMNQIKNVTQDRITNIKISNDDLEQAIGIIPPSAMRESYIEIPEISMDQIGGLEECKKIIEEAVTWRVSPPKELLEIGGEIPRGILLYGAPGCGKTMLGKAIANQSGINFIPVKGPEFVSMWVGESERAIRDLFEKARSLQPCVIFFDEIDAIAPKRSGNRQDGTNAIERMVNQLLSEFDGVASVKDIVIIGATNRPDIIDPALLRSERITYKIFVPLPDLKARKSIFNAHLTKINKIKTKGKIDYDKLAKITDTYSGADIGDVIRAATVYAVRSKKSFITQENLERIISDVVKPTVNSETLEMYEKFRERLTTKNQNIFSSNIYT